MSHSARYPEMTHQHYVVFLRNEAAAWSAMGYPGVAAYLRQKADRIADRSRCQACRADLDNRTSIAYNYGGSRRRR